MRFLILGGMWKKPFRKTGQPEEAEPAPAELTLKTRVEGFWQAWSQAAARFYEVIEDKRCGDLEAEVSAMVDEWLPEMAWVFGPGPDRKGHSFTLTPEGNPHRRFVVQYWLGRAPLLPGWTFYASRQADAIAGSAIRMDGRTFAATEIWMTPMVDTEEEKVDITVWHPLFAEVDENTCHTVVFLWLDEALGEDGTVNWIGEVKLGDGALAQSIPLTELPEYIAGLEQEHGWKKSPPNQTFTGYSITEPEPGPLRSDIIAGSSRHFPIVQDYPLEENPLAEFGAEYVMAVFPTSRLVQGKEVDCRGQVEDALTEALERDAAGEVLGGAIGQVNTYIDLILYDGAKSREIAGAVLDRSGVGGSWRLEPFTEK